MKPFVALAGMCLLSLVVPAAAAADNRTLTTDVVVYNSDGKPAGGRRVVLVFTSALGGVTGSFYTDSSGTASVRHASSGKVKVFVDGDQRGTGTAPGRLFVYLRAKSSGESGLRRAMRDFKQRLARPNSSKPKVSPGPRRLSTSGSTSKSSSPPRSSSSRSRPSTSRSSSRPPSSTKPKATPPSSSKVKPSSSSSSSRPRPSTSGSTSSKPSKSGSSSSKSKK